MTEDDDEVFAARIRDKTILTTGDAARVMRCSIQVVIRLIDAGKLAGWRVPGAKCRRVQRIDLLKFMWAGGIPTDLLVETRQEAKA